MPYYLIFKVDLSTEIKFGSYKSFMNPNTTRGGVWVVMTLLIYEFYHDHHCRFFQFFLLTYSTICKIFFGEVGRLQTAMLVLGFFSHY